MHADLQKVIVSEEQIRQRVTALGQELTEAYPPEVDLTFIAIINGALMFASDLMRKIERPLLLDCIRVSSYKDDINPVTDPEIFSMIQLDIKGAHVLLIDDVFDTGLTLEHVVGIFRKKGPASLKTCVLLEKRGRSKVRMRPDFIGFSIPDEFVVGYGLDFAERYRNLPCIGVLRPELQNPPEWRSA